MGAVGPYYPGSALWGRMLRGCVEADALTLEVYSTKRLDSDLRG